MLAAFAATPDQLYQTWQKSNIDQPEAAVKAAQDYLHAAPKGPHAHELQVWLDAYNKALASLLSSRPGKAPPNIQPAPNSQVASGNAPNNKPAPPAQSPPPAKPAVPPPAFKQAEPALPVQLAEAAPKNEPAPALPVPRPAQPADTPPQTRLASAAPPTNGPEENATPNKQTPRAAPDSTPDNGPKPLGQSLDETLAFIGDRVADVGTITFMAQFRNPANDYDLVEQLSYWASGVTIDPNRCQVSFHWHVNQDGKGLPDQDRAIQLRLARNIRVETIDQALGDLNAAAGLRYSVHAQPEVYAVHIDRIDNRAGDNLYFRDQDMAARVVKAAQHAQELCNGGR